MKNLKYILILAGIIFTIIFLRSCETTWKPLSSVLGMRADTVKKTVYKDKYIPIPAFILDSLKAEMKYEMPVKIRDRIITKADSDAIFKLIWEKDSIRELLSLANVKVNAVCDSSRKAQGDSIQGFSLHIEYDEIQRYFHNFRMEITPFHFKEPMTTTIITKEPRFTFGIGGGIGLNSNLNATNIQFGWNVGVQLTYNLWSF